MSDLTLFDAIERYLKAKEAAGLKARTIHIYNERLAPFAASLGRLAALSAVSPDDIDGYIVDLRRRKEKHENNRFRPSESGGLADATINGVIGDIKAFFKWAVDRGHIDKSPAVHLKKKRESRLATDKAMAAVDLVAMLDFLELSARARNWVDIRDLALLSFMADSLARRGEVASLNTNSIDFDKPFRDANGLDTFQAKVSGKVGRRVVTISEQAALYVSDWLDTRPDVAPDIEGDPLFTTLCRWHRRPSGGCTACKQFGRRLSAQAIYRIFDRLGKRVGIDGRVNPHSLRHLGGILYARQAGIEVAQEKLGHSTITTTRDYYVPDDMRRVHEATNILSFVQGTR